MDRDMWIATAIVGLWILGMALFGRPARRDIGLPALRPPTPQVSNRGFRRVVARTVALLTVFSVLFLNLADFGTAEPPSGPVLAVLVLLPILSLSYFIFVIIYVLFLTLAREQFDADARLLLGETVLSILFNIASAALLYKLLGISPPSWDAGPVADMTYLYFSTVTFSTLGYGDFAPLQSARGVAAFQAVLGNLHLGIFVGTVLVALKSSSDQARGA
jgi:voltage-gated potassium channel Kch